MAAGRYCLMQATCHAFKCAPTSSPSAATWPMTSWPGMSGSTGVTSVAVDGVKVGVANAAGLDLDQHLAAPGLGDRHVFIVSGVRSSREHRGLHASSWTSPQSPRNIPRLAGGVDVAESSSLPTLARRRRAADAAVERPRLATGRPSARSHSPRSRGAGGADKRGGRCPPCGRC